MGTIVPGLSSVDTMTRCAASILLPVYNEADGLPELADRLSAVLTPRGKPFELLFVDDGSTDATPAVLARLELERPYVRFIRLRRNNGKSLALMAGFRHVRGQDAVVTMDGDLQDRPEDVPALLDRLDEGWDLVNGWRVARQDEASRKLGSRLYNATVRRLSGLDIHDQNCGLKAYRRSVIDTLCVYGQYHRYIPLQVHLAGFRVTEQAVGNDQRRYGASKFPTFRYQGLFDLLSLMFTHKFALNPLHFFGVAGSTIIIPSFLLLVWFVLNQVLFWLGFGDEFKVVNRPLLLISATAFLFGVFTFFTGFVCDFILHHQIRSRIDDVLALAIERRPDKPHDHGPDA